MRYGEVRGVGKPVSRLVQGTIPVNSKRLDESFALLDAVLEVGGNTFDTAHVYGGGDNERVFGRWVRERGVREQIVILAKGAHHNQDRNRVTPFDITADLHDSLARMQVDYVDLYLLHRDDPSVPVGPIVDALTELIRAGKVRAWGGSNWTHQRIQEANAYAEQNGLAPMAASSPQFSLAEQVKEPWANCVSITGPANEEARRFYAETQMPVFAWSSLAGGFFSGQITRDRLHFDDYYMKLAVDCYAVEANFNRLDRANELAARKGCTLPQIAMAYVMSVGLNLFALVGCNNGGEFRQNAEALTLNLTPEEIAYLELRMPSL